MAGSGSATAFRAGLRPRRGGLTRGGHARGRGGEGGSGKGLVAQPVRARSVEGESPTEGSKRERKRDEAKGGKRRLSSTSGVEDNRYADVSLESLREALASYDGSCDEGVTGPDYSSVQRNLALELVRVTEAAALEAGRWFGRGSEEKAYGAAVKGMRKVLNALEIDGVVVIGHGAFDDEEENEDEDDEKAFVDDLLCGDRIGCGYGQEVDVAVKALDGANLVSEGHHGSITVMAVADRGSLMDCGPCDYMEKLVVGSPRGGDVVSLDHPLEANLRSLASRLEKPVHALTVAVLDRPRNRAIIDECRRLGTRIRLFTDGDLAMSLEAARPDGDVDIMIGVGGSQEGVLTACAIKCTPGGFMEARLWPKTEDERELAVEMDLNLGVLGVDDLVKGDEESRNEVYFAATGLSDGFLKGVRFHEGGASTQSLVLRSASGTVRKMETQHHWSKPGLTNVSEI